MSGLPTFVTYYLPSATLPNMILPILLVLHSLFQGDGLLSELLDLHKWNKLLVGYFQELRLGYNYNLNRWTGVTDKFPPVLGHMNQKPCSIANIGLLKQVTGINSNLNIHNLPHISIVILLSLKVWWMAWKEVLTSQSISVPHARSLSSLNDPLCRRHQKFGLDRSEQFGEEVLNCLLDLASNHLYEI